MMKRMMFGMTSVLIVAILLLGLPLVAGYIANEFPAASLDPNGVFWWISVHHIAQAVLFIPFVFLLKKTKPELNLGFGWGDKKRGWTYVWRFTVFFLIYTVIGFGIAIVTGTFNSYNFPINARNIFGYLGFQLFLSGPSEEFLFRLFGISLLGLFFKKRLFKGKLSSANLIIAVIFGLAHVGIYFSPFSLSYNIVQLVYAFVLGIVYGDVYEKTGSIYYSMMIHSISNVIAVGATMLMTVIL